MVAEALGVGAELTKTLEEMQKEVDDFTWVVMFYTIVVVRVVTLPVLRG